MADLDDPPPAADRVSSRISEGRVKQTGVGGILEKALPITVIVVVFLLGALALSPFLPALLWSVFISVALLPLYERAVARTGQRSGLATRFATPNARIMVHQPSGGFQGQASDIERHAQDIIKLKRRLNEVYVMHTGKDYETIESTLDRDHFMTSDEAMEFGLIDRVISSREAMEKEVKD